MELSAGSHFQDKLYGCTLFVALGIVPPKLNY